MKQPIYPFKLDRENIPIENNGYPNTGSFIYRNDVEKHHVLIEINQAEVSKLFPDISQEAFLCIVRNIVRFTESEIE